MSDTLDHARDHQDEAVRGFHDDQADDLTDTLVAALDQALRALQDTPRPAKTVH